MAVEEGFQGLSGERYVALTTYRRTGAPVVTPLGPLVRDGKLYFLTPASSGKVRRLQRNPNVEVAPCTMRGSLTGPARSGRGRILAGAEADAVKADFRRAWGWQWYLMQVQDRILGRSRVCLEIVPA